MRSTTLTKLCLLAIITLLLLLPSVSLTQQTCERRGKIIQDADVYEQIPKYVTGSGWQGHRVMMLRSNTQVYICGEQSVDFGFSTKVWVQIAYEKGNGKWQYGWIFHEKIQFLSGRLHEIDPTIRYSLIGTAFADEPAVSSPNKTEWKLGPPPPVPTSQDEGTAASSTKEPSPTTLSDLGVLYWPLFAAMLLGMGAKAGVDLIDASDKSLKKEHLRNAVVAFLVSPIVFLGFLSAGQFSASPQTFVVLWLLAFQNGFFWQTILKRNVNNTQQTNKQ